MTEPKLYKLAGSPWSFKTLWALKYQGVSVTIVEIIPKITEWYMCIRYWKNRITWPLLETPSETIFESLEIAQWAAAKISASNSLFPEGYAKEIAQWNEKSDAMLSCSRKTFINRVLQDQELQISLLPAPLKLLGPIGRWLVRSGLTQFGEKHSAAHSATDIQKCRRYLAELDEALKQGGGYVVAGRFTYADITMATALSLLDFLHEPWSQRLFSERVEFATVPTELAGQYPHLLTWRRSILEKHFPFKEPL